MTHARLAGQCAYLLRSVLIRRQVHPCHAVEHAGQGVHIPEEPAVHLHVRRQVRTVRADGESADVGGAAGEQVIHHFASDIAGGAGDHDGQLGGIVSHLPEHRAGPGAGRRGGSLSGDDCPLPRPDRRRLGTAGNR